MSNSNKYYFYEKYVKLRLCCVCIGDCGKCINKDMFEPKEPEEYFTQHKRIEGIINDYETHDIKWEDIKNSTLQERRQIMKEKYKFILYLIRWQLSTPILALCLKFLNFSTLVNTIIANLIGGIIFYNIDKYIFNRHKE